MKERLNSICFTCLSVDRKLTKLNAVGNNAFNLFQRFYHDTLASDTLKFILKERQSLVICWECKTSIRKLCKFREQVCIAQRQLASILVESRNKTNIKPSVKPLTRLRSCHKIGYDTDYIENNEIDPLEDCKPDFGIIENPLEDCKPDFGIIENALEVCNPGFGIIEDDLDIPLNIVAKTIKNSDFVIVKTEKNPDDNESTSYRTTADHETKKRHSNMGNDIKIEVQTDYTVNNGLKTESETLSNYISTDTDNDDDVNTDSERTTDYEKYDAKTNDSYIEIKNKEVTTDKINKQSENTVLNSNSSDSEIADSIIENEMKKTDENDYFFIIRLKEKEFFERIKKLKAEREFKSAKFKCEPCVLLLKDDIELRMHKVDCHKKKPNHSQCDICKMYVKNKSILKHRNSHLILYQCKICYQVCYTNYHIKLHLRREHFSHNIKVLANFELSEEESMDDSSESSYPCPDCNQVFKSNDFRYKHIKYIHSTGLSSYDRQDETRSGDEKIEEPCLICDKMVRVELMRVHARLHVESRTYECVACKKTFVSLTKYEYHLKTAAVHVKLPIDPLKFKCTICSKKFRVEHELKDHINFRHLKRTHHKCPVCHKALATQRSVDRHIKKAHTKVTDQRKRDHMCQTCGKSFLTNNRLEEHERIHTGVRPLSCNECGRAFRQKAALYMHKRLVHKVPLKSGVEHVSDNE